jgi:hypothetical protein
MISSFHHLISKFNLLKLTITIQFQQDAVLPAFKGSMLHGWFGHALKTADEHAFFICYGNHDNQQPKPYIICPSDDHKTHWRQGELYSFEISLFGEATKLVDKVFIATKIGEKLGFGSQRIPFKVLSIASNTPTGLKVGAEIFSLADALTHSHIDIMSESESEVALTFITPTRIKHQGAICHHAIPDLNFVVNQILRRLTQISRFWVLDDQELIDSIYNHKPTIRPHQVTNHCYFEDWQRFSQKSREHLPFGGLKGQVSFFGNIGHVIPLLRIGEILHIGGKTTFGLGKYQLIV